jgi:hypothetical protein
MMDKKKRSLNENTLKIFGAGLLAVTGSVTHDAQAAGPYYLEPLGTCEADRCLLVTLSQEMMDRLSDTSVDHKSWISANRLLNNTGVVQQKRGAALDAAPLEFQVVVARYRDGRLAQFDLSKPFLFTDTETYELKHDAKLNVIGSDDLSFKVELTAFTDGQTEAKIKGVEVREIRIEAFEGGRPPSTLDGLVDGGAERGKTGFVGIVPTEASATQWKGSLQSQGLFFDWKWRNQN